MNASWLRAHAQVLSVAPVFDEDTATLMGRLFAGRLVEDSDEGFQDAFRELRLAGLIIGTEGAWRVADPLRADLRARLRDDHPNLFAIIAQAFIEHADNGFGPQLRQVLGDFGASLNLATLEIAAARQTRSGEQAFSRLIDVVSLATHAGRTGDAGAAVRLVAALPYEESRSRQISFLSGLSAWHQGNRESAIDNFETVLSEDVRDKAAAISAHLVGVQRHHLGSSSEALRLLHYSVDLLRDLDDSRGLALSLTSLGRIERDRFSQAGGVGAEEVEFDPSETGVRIGDEQLYEELEISDGISTLEEAVTVAYLVDERTAGVALIELAAALERLDLADAAIATAEEARDLIPNGDPQYLHALTVLGGLYRGLGRYEDAARVLEEGIELAEDYEEILPLAKLLNVLASSERNKGQSDLAVLHASQSVDLGRKLKDRRHLSHALHTLAGALIDTAKTDDDRRQAESYLDEADRLLKKLNDRRGLRMVAQTRQRLKSK